LGFATANQGFKAVMKQVFGDALAHEGPNLHDFQAL